MNKKLAQCHVQGVIMTNQPFLFILAALGLLSVLPAMLFGFSIAKATGSFLVAPMPALCCIAVLCWSGHRLEKMK